MVNLFICFVICKLSLWLLQLVSISDDCRVGVSGGGDLRGVQHLRLIEKVLEVGLVISSLIQVIQVTFY